MGNTDQMEEIELANERRKTCRNKLEGDVYLRNFDTTNITRWKHKFGLHNRDVGHPVKMGRRGETDAEDGTAPA